MSHRLSLIFFLVLFPSILSLTPSDSIFKTAEPVIGIMTGSWNEGTQYTQHIASSYVLWLEMQGVRVVPVLYNNSIATLREQVAQLNGLLFQGGSMSFLKRGDFLSWRPEWNEIQSMFDPDSGQMTEYAYKSCEMIKYSMELHDQGKPVAVWGTCNGFQLIGVCFTDNPQTLLSYFNDTHVNHNLQMTTAAQKDNMFGYNTSLWDVFTKQNELNFNHHYGISPERFDQDEKLKNSFEILSYSNNSQSQTFISAYRAKKYPIFASQFHPEKAAFQYEPSKNIAHSKDAIRATRHLSQYFVNQTRMSGNKWQGGHQDLLFRHTCIDASQSGYEGMYFW